MLRPAARVLRAPAVPSQLGKALGTHSLELHEVAELLLLILVDLQSLHSRHQLINAAGDGLPNVAPLAPIALGRLILPLLLRLLSAARFSARAAAAAAAAAPSIQNATSQAAWPADPRRQG